MKSLTVVYDPTCDLAGRTKEWMISQRSFLYVEFLPAGSETVRARFPGLPGKSAPGAMTAVDEEGNFWLGWKAWLMCLWSLHSHRCDAMALARRDPRLARRFVELILRHRHRLSAWRLL